MNWGIKVLQTSALPLGYAAEKKGGSLRKRNPPYLAETNPANGTAKNPNLERETGLEPATATLAR